jgi:hypothetical protein
VSLEDLHALIVWVETLSEAERTTILREIAAAVQTGQMQDPTRCSLRKTRLGFYQLVWHRQEAVDAPA